MTDDPHRCLAGPACRNAERIDGQRHGARTIDPHTLCDPCVDHIADCARQLPADYSLLADSLGERTGNAGEFVRSTPTPAIPINAGAEAIMAAIYEIADRAAAVVSETIGADHPGERSHYPRPQPLDTGNGKKQPPVVGSLALHILEEHSRPRPYRIVQACARMIEPHIATLAAAPAEPHLVWSKPHRCERHATLISSAEALIKIMRGPDLDVVKAEHANACRAAAHCDDCNGWGTDGQARGFTEFTGMDIANQIRDIHHQTRAHLGHTRLREHYTMPCPAVDKHGEYCGAMTLGRDDGSDWVDCTTCGTQWTEREYEWLKTQIAGDKEIEMLRWLLAEAYWRLDTLKRGADAIEDDPRLNEPGSGQFVLDGIKIILAAGDGHQPPEERKTTPERKSKGKR